MSNSRDNASRVQIERIKLIQKLLYFAIFAIVNKKLITKVREAT